ncbi:HAD hydrolase-like protein [Verminephrobacter sp. Larva24]|nr:HAD hydrolase-like protein [Verminephrobacter sp. Larva24]
MTGAVLFDLDGTLADTSGDLAAATCDALAAVGLPSPEPHTLHAYGSRGGRGMLRAGWSGDLDDALFQRAFAVFLERYALRMYESTVLFDGVGACLEQLARGGRRWGIVTNKGERYTRPLVKQLGLQPEVLVCGDMVPQSKPAPAMSAGLRPGVFCSEKKQYGWRWAPTAKHLTGIPWEVASMIDGLDDTWPTSLRPDATTATPSMFGPPGWIVRFTPSCS